MMRSRRSRGLGQWKPETERTAVAWLMHGSTRSRRQCYLARGDLFNQFNALTYHNAKCLEPAQHHARPGTPALFTISTHPGRTKSPLMYPVSSVRHARSASVGEACDPVVPASPASTWAASTWASSTWPAHAARNAVSRAMNAGVVNLDLDAIGLRWC